MIGMWIIPFVISIKFYHLRFLIIWFIFTIITGTIAFKSSRAPISRTTPRLVYVSYNLYDLNLFFLISTLIKFRNGFY